MYASLCVNCYLIALVTVDLTNARIQAHRHTQQTLTQFDMTYAPKGILNIQFV